MQVEMNYKKTREAMEELTERFYQNHKSLCDSEMPNNAWLNGSNELCIEYGNDKEGEWENGKPVKAWWDINGKLCIEYENGKCWHYDSEGKWW